MKISIFGLGYVGSVTAACLAEQGHEVTGVDVHPQKVAQFNAGQAPIVEPGLDVLLRRAHERGLLRATERAEEAITQTDLSLVCVGTPSKHTGALDLSHVREVSRQIAQAVQSQNKRHVLVYRSTMLPGSTRMLIEEELSRVVGAGMLEVLYYPEFLREGTAVQDFREPSLAVVGTAKGQPYARELGSLLGETSAVVNWDTAEMIKYACNAFHAAKVAFANEIGRLSKGIGIDGQTVMNLLCRDQRLNISTYYLRPGNPFGGSCLPKDVRALADFARQQRLSLPVIENLLVSNQEHLHRLLQLIAERGHREIVILGLSFKSDTDDLRESAMVEVAQNLVAHGYKVRIYDPQLKLARMIGSNIRVLEIKMPRLASLLQADLASALGKGGLVLAAQRCVAMDELARLITADHHVLDINGWPELRSLPATYEGFCW